MGEPALLTAKQIAVYRAIAAACDNPRRVFKGVLRVDDVHSAHMSSILRALAERGIIKFRTTLNKNGLAVGRRIRLLRRLREGEIVERPFTYKVQGEGARNFIGMSERSKDRVIQDEDRHAAERRDRQVDAFDAAMRKAFPGLAPRQGGDEGGGGGARA